MYPLALYKLEGTILSLNFMKALTAIAALSSILLLSYSAYSIFQECKPKPKTVPYVDLAKYSGTWFEQAVIPFIWIKGC